MRRVARAGLALAVLLSGAGRAVAETGEDAQARAVLFSIAREECMGRAKVFVREQDIEHTLGHGAAEDTRWQLYGGCVGPALQSVDLLMDGVETGRIARDKAVGCINEMTRNLAARPFRIGQITWVMQIWSCAR